MIIMRKAIFYKHAWQYMCVKDWTKSMGVGWGAFGNVVDKKKHMAYPLPSAQK